MRKPLLKEFDSTVMTLGRDARLPKTIAARTRRVYDVVSTVYPLSTFFFHSRAHKTAVELSGIRNGMRVLEVATGSGEMFRRLVRANPDGSVIGIDLSPRMAARTYKQVRDEFPDVNTHCQAVDARYLPFADNSFDAIVCCYLLELLATEDIVLTIEELRRVLRPKGTVTIVLIGQYTPAFNRLYRVASRLAPAFWGRQVESRVPQLLEASRFKIYSQREVRQIGYPSRVVAARKA
jgi:ubiquinone/menaquinone biosynthesis C-methylase UbiE